MAITSLYNKNGLPQDIFLDHKRIEKNQKNYYNEPKHVKRNIGAQQKSHFTTQEKFDEKVKTSQENKELMAPGILSINMVDFNTQQAKPQLKNKFISKID